MGRWAFTRDGEMNFHKRWGDKLHKRWEDGLFTRDGEISFTRDGGDGV
jgi:hypothetical protein